MLFFLGLVVRALARLLVSPCHDDGSKELEILVLRHELRVLRRKAGPRPSAKGCTPGHASAAAIAMSGTPFPLSFRHQWETGRLTRYWQRGLPVTSRSASLCHVRHRDSHSASEPR